MATSKPSVSPVKGLDLRSINAAMNEIRQQFIVLNEQIQYVGRVAGQNALGGNNTAQSLNSLASQISALQTQLTALQAGSLAPTASYVASADITSGDPVYETGEGFVAPVDTQDMTAVFACIGVAIANAALGSQVVVRRSGIFANATTGLEVGRAVYAQIGAGLTQQPNYATVAIPVGVATSSTDIAVRGGWPALRELPLYDDGYENFMPVALGLIRHVYELVDSLFGQEDGIVVKVGDQLVTREIVTPSGSGLNVMDGDGVFGNPSIS